MLVTSEAMRFLPTLPFSRYVLSKTLLFKWQNLGYTRLGKHQVVISRQSNKFIEHLHKEN